MMQNARTEQGRKEILRSVLKAYYTEESKVYFITDDVIYWYGGIHVREPQEK